MQLGKYQLLDRLGTGGMAEIYRAKTVDENGTPHLVAVKRVLGHLAQDQNFIQMLLDEATIASFLNHPAIARVYEFAQVEGEYFIAMEYVDGKNLRTVLGRCRRAGTPVPEEHAAWIAAEIASALHAAHCQADASGQPLRLVHRDVSPANLMCSYAGEVKLCDFGIAKATLSQVHTKTGVVKGKVKYMSPEQAMGRKLDHRSDLFSLGTVLYEMLTCHPPFVAPTEMDLLAKVREVSYSPLSSRRGDFSPELGAIVDKLLARSRGARYQTGAELEAALRSFLDRRAPGYSRAHLGRYLRKMFEADIQRDIEQSIERELKG